MANLIITIIAIALLAIMAIAGAWYGSTAFTEAQAKAAAKAIVSQAQQISGAMQLWALQNSGDFSLSSGSQYTRTFPNLVPVYLSAWPIAPRQHMATSAFFWDGKYNWTLVNFVEGATGLSATLSNPNAVLVSFSGMPEGSQLVCREAHRIANGSKSGDGVPRSPADSYAYHRPSDIRAACWWRDANDNGVYDAGENAGTWFVFWFR